MSTTRVALIGAGLAVFTVAVAAVLLATGVVSLPKSPQTAAQGPVLVALVLPDESGVQVPRVLDVYTRTQSGWSIASVLPTLPAVVSGTSGGTLADAYVFGGGDALASAYSAGHPTPVSAWVVVDQTGWDQLAGSTPISIELPAHMEVFDGAQLTVFEQGPASVPATQTGALLNGASYLSTLNSGLVRSRIGDVLAGQLSRARPQDVDALKSSLDRTTLAAWLGGLGTARRSTPQ
ncbi:MAG: hypothetical protein P4L93_12190 [Coriobacteriia bacterium]|nr:hypothetical protein [Coriobacteriia bacterium]